MEFYFFFVGIYGDVLLAFSVVRIGDKILNSPMRDGSLACLNGLRVISMLWVMLGHSVSFSTAFTSKLALLFFCTITNTTENKNAHMQYLTLSF